MTNDGIQLRLGDILFAIKNRWKMILIFSLVGLILGGIATAVSYLQMNMSQDFEIRGALMTTSIQKDGKYVYGNNYPGMDDVRYATEITDEAVYVLKSEQVIKNAVENLGLIGVTGPDVRQVFTAYRVETTQVIEMKLLWRTGEEGMDIMDAIIKEANTMISGAMHAGELTVITEPYVKQAENRNVNLPVWGYLFALGFFAGIAAAISELILHPVLTNLKDVESVFGLETLGIIPKDDEFFNKRGVFVEGEPLPEAVEQNYSSTAYIIKNRLDSAGEKCFYVTSSETGEGKTTAASSLALSLSGMGKRVLLVDFDVKNPGIANMFLEKVDYSNTLNALYKGSILINEAILHVSPCLDIIPMILESTPVTIDSAVTEAIENEKEKYDYIIIDGPAIGESSEALSINQLTNYSIFVIRHGKTPLKAIENALDTVTKSGAYIIGCIVNADTSHQEIRRVRRKNKGKDQNSVQNEKPQNRTRKDKAAEKEEKKAAAAFMKDERSDETENPSDEDMVNAIIKYGLEGDAEDGRD